MWPSPVRGAVMDSLKFGRVGEEEPLREAVGGVVLRQDMFVGEGHRWRGEGGTKGGLAKPG